jgi:hypothetical protein
MVKIQIKFPEGGTLKGELTMARIKKLLRHLSGEGNNY